MTTTSPSGTVGAIDPALVHQLVDKIVARPRAQRETTVAPFTGKPLAELPISTPADVEAAFRAAARAQARWAARPVEERARTVGRIHDLILDRQSEVADLVQTESGKARRDAFEEIGDVALAARYVAARGPRLLRDRAPTTMSAPAARGASKRGMSAGACWPSESIRTTNSLLAARMPVFRAAP